MHPQSNGVKKLSSLFRARSVAIVGASDSNPWSRLVGNTLNAVGFAGDVHLVNKRGSPALERSTVTSCSAIGAPVDAAFIVVPATAVQEALEDVAASGIRCGVVVSSGFAETGGAGAEVQRRVFGRAAELGLTLLGPNSIGFVNFADGVGLGAFPLKTPIVRGGAVGVISQSGATAGQLLRFSQQQQIGLSYAVALGNEGMIDAAAVLEFLIEDKTTRVIAMFMESIRSPARFIASARTALQRRKPVVILKVGRGALAAQVAQAHTGALVGDDRIFDAVCREVGAVRVFSLEQLLLTADLLAHTGVVEDKGFALASISGGACEMAADLGEAAGVRFARFAAQTQEKLAAVLPDFGTAHNPLDVTGEALRNPKIFEDALTIMSSDPDVGLLACIYDLPGAEADILRVTRPALDHIAHGLRAATGPALVIQQTIRERSEFASSLATELKLPLVTGGLDYALQAIGHAYCWSAGVRKAQPAAQVPSVVATTSAHPLGERAVLDYLASRGVPVIPATVVSSRSEAVAAAQRIGGPVALKILSPDIAHKTEVGGVLLSISDPSAVGDGYDAILRSVGAKHPQARIDGIGVSPMRGDGTELLVGILRDPHWGLALTVGLGGIWVELLHDVALRLLPVTTGDVIEMLSGLKAGVLLRGYRGAPAADIEAVAAVIVAIGDAAFALGPQLTTLEVNPLFVSAARIECLDALALWSNSSEQ